MNPAPRLLTPLRSLLKPSTLPHRPLTPISLFNHIPPPKPFTSPHQRRFASSFGSSPLPTSSSGSSSSGSSRFRSELAKPTTIVLIFVPILCGFLGVWQVKRLRWKVALIDEVERNLHKEPMILPSNINLSALPDFSFRRILLQGRLLPLPILLGPQVKDGVPGYALIQPLVRPDGASTILLNRGFITTTRASAIRAGTENVPGPESTEDITVECMLMRPGELGFWTPENKVEGNEWFWRDVVGMAQHAGGDEKGVQPVLVDAIDRGEAPATYLMQRGIPVGRPPQVELRNQHLSYAYTWFSLCAATSAMLYFLLSKGRRAPRMEKRIRDL